METQIWYPPRHAGWVVGELNKGTTVPVGSSVQERASPPALDLKLENSLYHMSLALFKLQSLCWSFGALFVSLCVGPLRGHFGVQPSISNVIPTNFNSQMF